MVISPCQALSSKAPILMADIDEGRIRDRIVPDEAAAEAPRRLARPGAGLIQWCCIWLCRSELSFCAIVRPMAPRGQDAQRSGHEQFTAARAASMVI